MKLPSLVTQSSGSMAPNKKYSCSHYLVQSLNYLCLKYMCVSVCVCACARVYMHMYIYLKMMKKHYLNNNGNI